MLTPQQADEIYLERLQLLEQANKGHQWAVDWFLGVHARHVFVGSGCQVWVRRDAPLTPGQWSVTAEFARVHAADVEALLVEHAASQEARAVAAAEDAVAERTTAVRECEDDYASRPWARYWLVTTSDGHIHSSTGCSTCNKGRSPTGFALVPYLSGQTVEAAVADLGPALCSVCYPSAPVEAREQARISARLALALAERGSEAFQEARREAQEAARKRAADRCPGSGSPTVKCPICGHTGRRGRVLPHKRVRWAVDFDWGREWWTGAGWGKRKDRHVFDSKADAQAVAAARQGARVCVS